jgi:tRNA(Ile)-lysidine synthase
MKTNWKSIINEIISIKDCDGFLLAVSGGSDSMALLELFSRLYKLHGIDYTVVTVDHNCADHKKFNKLDHASIVFNMVELLKKADWSPRSAIVIRNQEVITKPNLESKARDFRWSKFNAIAKEKNLVVVTGHHLDDNIENAFMRLVAGKPIETISMKRFIKKDGVTRYKPLLSVPKQELIKRLKAVKWDWVEDESNFEDVQLRNVFRNSILPKIEELTNYRKSMHRVLDSLSK